MAEESAFLGSTEEGAGAPTYKSGEDVRLGDTVRARWPTGKGEVSRWHQGTISEIHDDGSVTVSSPERSFWKAFKDKFNFSAAPPLRGRDMAYKLELVGRAPEHGQEQKQDTQRQRTQQRKSGLNS